MDAMLKVVTTNDIKPDQIKAIRLRAGRKELFEPEINKHHGRIFKLMGDGLLAEFGSVVDAVECAVTLQRGMVERNASVPGLRVPVEHLVGVHQRLLAVDRPRARRSPLRALRTGGAGRAWIALLALRALAATDETQGDRQSAT